MLYDGLSHVGAWELWFKNWIMGNPKLDAFYHGFGLGNNMPSMCL